MKKPSFWLTALLIYVIILGPVLPQLAFADVEEPSAFALPYEPARKRNIFFPPLISFVLPGFDQWWESQYLDATIYTGMAGAGFVYAFSPLRDIDRRHESLGAQLISAAGGFSAYASFRSAVGTRKPHGEFEFLAHEETFGDILKAPFQFEYLLRPTTWLPLGVALGLGILIGSGKSNINNFSLSDAYFAFNTSFLAGTWEEAVFRGWMMPSWMHLSKSPFISNLFTSVIFALAHLSPSNPLPWPQFLFGMWAGWVSQKNGWAISEPIFFHTWYDVILFTTYYSMVNRAPNIYLPVMHFRF